MELELSTEDKKQINQWCEALESGKYKQTRHRLQESKGYCCLGVACELFGENLKRDKDGYLVGKKPFDQRNEKATIPDWLVRINYASSIYSLTCYNDIQKLSFKEIAKKIRKQFL